MPAEQFAAWLERHDLADLETVLAAHGIDLQTLPHLTEADLKEMALNIGQRRRLSLALETIRGATLVEPRTERRRLTVLFVDLVGSTALSAILDPEDMRELIHTFQNAAAGEIGRYAGHLAKFMGDGVLAYFGWPKAHENDAERAVRASLAILRAVSHISAPGGKRLEARAGIATGTVVVEDGSGSGAGAETGIVGMTPNLAARLQGLAAPGETIIAASTRSLIHGLFEVEALGTHALKGFAEPQPAFRIVGVQRVETRFEAQHEEMDPATMVGRSTETARLAEAWAQAERGAGTVILVEGEAGLGKSRLIQSLQRLVRGRRHHRICYQCSPFHETTALWPVTEQLAQVTGLPGEVDPTRRLARLRTWLGQAGVDLSTHLPPVADLLGLADATDPVTALAPAERKRRLFGALLAQLAGLADEAPVLIVIEDVHWIDPTTSELVELALTAVPDLRVLAIATFRPDPRPAWYGLPHATKLALAPLTPDEAMIIVAQVAPDLPPTTTQVIIDKADGIPLFIEEVARSIAESRPGRAGGEQPAVPTSLHDTLMARFDRLEEARRVAQIGAAIGRVFTSSLIERCIDLPNEQLGKDLAKLAASGLVSRHRQGSDSVYMFKHALLQDAAYETLLHSQRRKIHGRIADALAAEGEPAPELLAQHLTCAGRAEAAIRAWREAARRAVIRSANREAAHHLRQALELRAELPDSAQSEATELALRLELAPALIAVHGFGSAQVAECAALASDLAERVGDEVQRFAALRLVWNSALMREPLLPGVLALAKELLRRATGSGNRAHLAIAQRALGYSLCMTGSHRDALLALERGIELADGIGTAPFALFGEHPGIVCRFYAAWSLALLGESAASDRRSDEAVAMARELGNPHGLAWALVCAGVPAMFTENPQRAALLESEALSIAETYRLPQWTGFANSYLGWARLAEGQPAAGLVATNRGVELVHGTGAVLNTTILLWARAQCRLATGDVAGAAVDCDAAMAHVRSHGEGVVLPGLFWVAGRIAQAQQRDPAPYWRQAREIAYQQGTLAWHRRLAQSDGSTAIREVGP